MFQLIKAGSKAPLLLAGASVGLVSWGQHKDGGGKDGGGSGSGSGASTPRVTKQYVLTSPRGLFAIASPGPAQCEGSSGDGGGRPIFVSTSRRGDRMAVAAESEARLKAKGFLREVLNMWGTSDSDTHPWLWLDRNPTTPVHCFVGDDAPGLLPKIEAAAKRDPHSALVLIRPPASSAAPDDDAATAARLDGLGVAVLRGAVERVDPQAGLLLTRDERVLLFDSLTVQWGRRDRVGVEAAAVIEAEDDESAAAAQQRQQQRQRCEIVRPEGKLVAASASAAAAASAAMQGGKEASGCNRGCSRIVRRKSLHATGDGLHHIVASWRLSRTDTWPWVWLARDEQGPGLHVVVAHGCEALAAAEDRLAECSSRSGGSSGGGCSVLVVGRAGDGVSAAEYDKRGCARIEAEVEELDAAHGIIMLDDERIIVFDSLTFVHSERTGEA